MDVGIDFRTDSRYCLSVKGGDRDDRRTTRSAEPDRGTEGSSDPQGNGGREGTAIPEENKSPLDYYFGKPRIEMAGSECLVDGLEKIIEYSNTKITVSLGSQEITFWGDDLKINSFTREGAVVQGNITSMEFSS